MSAIRRAEGEGQAWLAVGLLTLGIYATVPLARAIQRAVEGAGGRQLFLVAVAVCFATALFLVLRRLRTGEVQTRHRVVWIAIALLYAASAWQLRRAPEEAVHLVEYGALGALAWHALRFRIADAWVFPAAACVGASAGMLDEALQWLTPDRHWDLRDLAINAGAATGIQVALAFGLPEREARAGSGPGRRLAVRFAALAWLLLGASLLNTPPRIARLAETLPGLASVRDRGDLMVEYGFRHGDPEIGSFYSRLELETLRELDLRRAPEAGATLARDGGDEVYKRFLATYNPITDPFLHELRVHLFRRDRYRETALTHRDDPPWLRRDATVAHRENQILERYFGHTLEQSGHGLSGEAREWLAEQHLPDRPYRSPVSRGLITSFGAREVAWGWALGFLVLAGASRTGR
ncbi:MAG: hypothetical protein CL910_11635 [Deltaproteobacteria bacterium]|jgi:VanZ family protein|nr:hypothetical protein [Deltaproteobacteria bacterium]